jgi:hypothetical protein
MKNILLYSLFAAGTLMTVVPAHAASTQPGEVVSVVKSQPQTMCCYSSTDTPLESSVNDYNLQVRVGAKVYDVEYDTALDYFPSNLVDGANVDVRLDHQRMYLQTSGGEPEAVVLDKLNSKAATEAKPSGK